MKKFSFEFKKEEISGYFDAFKRLKCAVSGDFSIRLIILN